MSNKKIYLDYAATTPVDPKVLKAMMPYFSKEFGNSMSLHLLGQTAKIALEQARQVVAIFIKAKSNEIIFTSSATESNNFALKGVAYANKEKGNHIIISAIEHPCIEESAKWLKTQGFFITKIPVDRNGLVNPEDIKKAITKKTILVSIIHASNEIGVIQNIQEIGKICKEKNVYFHTDASQSFGKILINVEKFNVDLLTASSHKIYGPKGVGLLYIRQGVKIKPLLHGGGQESGARSSTVNLPAIIGFAKAIEICGKEMKTENIRLSKLRDKIIKETLKIKGSYLNGSAKERLANNINVRFDFVEGESMVLYLDMEGISVSSGSACSSIKLEPSSVLLAIGLRPEQAHGSLRISLGRSTTEKEINYFLKVLPVIVEKIREMSPLK